MSTHTKTISLRATYESDLSKIREDLSTIKTFRRNLEATPLRVPIRLNLSSIRSDAVKAATEYKRALSASMASGTTPGALMSKGGVVIPASAAAEMRKFAATTKGTLKDIRRDVEGEAPRLIKSFEQIQAGLQRVAGATGSQKAGDSKDAIRLSKQEERSKRQGYNKRTAGFISRQDEKLNRRMTSGSKMDESAAKVIDNRLERERALNRVLDERERMLKAQADQYRKLEQVAKGKGFDESAASYRNAANRVEGKLGRVRLDRSRGNNEGIRSESDHQLKRRLDDAMHHDRAQRVMLKNEESAARGIENRRQREHALNRVLAKRSALQIDTSSKVTAVGAEAQRRGNRPLFDRSQNALGGVERNGIADMRRLTAATNHSGHAFNFHTSSLLKNAATFAKWYLPAQAAMGVFEAIRSGVSGAVGAERTFKVLNAVFRGTSQDAALLADQTLMLAAANGRSTDEAAQAAVAWARMGLTRTQILVAMESSLRAANVAEISAAEATAYLTANYKAFGQTIADIPATLDYINSLSNKNPVAPREIFEGLSRSASIAKDAGLTFQELAGIITTISTTTQRPGAEIGNAMKSIITRIGRPRTATKLKEEFGYDITDGAGDAKKMTQVLGELAAMYPTLNRLEKARLKDIVAGAHQGNRFAVIMETWNESLVAQMEAGLDSNSAMRENAQILDSVSAKMEKLNTTWQRLFHTMGEAGLFDWMGGVISDAGLLVDMLSRIGKTGSNGAANGAPPPVQSRLTGLEDMMAGLFIEGGRVSDFLGGNFSAFNNGLDSTDAEISFAARGLKERSWTRGVGESIESKIANDGSSFIAKDAAMKMAEEAATTRSRLGSLATAAKYFENLSQGFGGKGQSKEKMMNGFDRTMLAFSSAKDFPGGAAIAMSANKNLRPLLASGDVTGARAGLADLSYGLRKTADQEAARFASSLSAGIKSTEADLESATAKVMELQTTLADTEDDGAKKNIQSRIGGVVDTIKSLKDSLATLKEEWKQPVNNAFTDVMSERLQAFIAETKDAGEVFGKVLESFGGTGFATLDAKLKMGALMLNGNMLRQVKDATDSRVSMLDENDQSEIERLESTRGGGTDFAIDRAVDEIKRRMEARGTAATALDQAYNEATMENDVLVRRNDQERQAATLQTYYGDSRKMTESGMSRYEIGMNEGARLSNRTRGSMQELQMDVEDPWLGTGGAAQDAAELGSITERLVQSKQGLASMEDRMNRALAERLNMEGEITEENRKQNEESSRRLAMASREDQLRSAGAAAVLRGRGQSRFSMQEFQFFSQETRSAISGYKPGMVNGLDESERNQAERRGDLNREISGLAISLKSLRQNFDNLRPRAEDKAGGLIDTSNPLGRKAPDVVGIMNPDKEQVRMNLNMGPVSIDLDFSRHLQGIRDSLQVTFDTKLDAALTNIRSMLTQNAGPNTTPATNAW